MKNKFAVEKVSEELGMLIKECRVKKNMTQLELAEIMGYSQAAFVSQMENGDSKVPLETLGQLIEVLKLPEDRVITLLQRAFREHLLNEIQAGKKKRVLISD